MHDILIAIWGLAIHLIAGYLAWRHKTLVAERESHKDRASYLNSRLDQTCGKLRDVTADLEAHKKKSQGDQFNLSSLLDTAKKSALDYSKQVTDLKTALAEKEKTLSTHRFALENAEGKVKALEFKLASLQAPKKKTKK